MVCVDFILDFVEDTVKKLWRQERGKMSRLRDFSKKYPVTAILLLIMIIYFIILSLNGGSNNLETLVRFGALFPPLIKTSNQYYRLFTPIFMHIGIMHLFGTQLEKLMGHGKFLFFFLLTGLGGNLVTYFLSLNSVSAFSTVSAGASGSLFGLLGAFLYLIQRHREMITPEGRKSIVVLVILNLVLTLVVPSISITAHFGGLIIGYLLSYLFIK